MYCYTCKQQRVFRRHVGLISLMLMLMTGGLWIFIILFYTKKCSGCGCTIGNNRLRWFLPSCLNGNPKFVQSEDLANKVETKFLPDQPRWLTEGQGVQGDNSDNDNVNSQTGQPFGLYVAYVVVAVVAVYGMYAWCGAVQ